MYLYTTYIRPHLESITPNRAPYLSRDVGIVLCRWLVPHHLILSRYPLIWCDLVWSAKCGLYHFEAFKITDRMTYYCALCLYILLFFVYSNTMPNGPLKTNLMNPRRNMTITGSYLLCRYFRASCLHICKIVGKTLRICFIVGLLGI